MSSNQPPITFITFVTFVTSYHTYTQRLPKALVRTSEIISVLLNFVESQSSEYRRTLSQVGSMMQLSCLFLLDPLLIFLSFQVQNFLDLRTIVSAGPFLYAIIQVNFFQHVLKNCLDLCFSLLKSYP